MGFYLYIFPQKICGRKYASFYILIITRPLCRANSFRLVERFRSTNPYFLQYIIYEWSHCTISYSYSPFLFSLLALFLGNVNIPCWEVLEVLPVIHLKRFALSTVWTFHSEYSFLGRMKKYSLISGVQNSLCYFCEDLLRIWYCANISLFVYKALMNKHLRICAAIANPHLTTKLMAFSLKPNHFACCQASLHFVHQTRELLT